MTESTDYITWAYYLIPVLFVFIYTIFKSYRQSVNKHILETAHREGLAEPASLHPVFDETKCLGCKACVSACPENNVIGIIHNKAQLINPSHCIGHGACKKACPFDAISLVFGTEKRGVDIPFVSENFETNIPGIFIAGELGGMGLIRNAIEQGKQALKAIKEKTKSTKNNKIHDVIIVGAGPAGISATLAAHQDKLNYLTIEQDSLGGTVFNFPRGKIVMTAPVNLPIIGKVKIHETSKEALLELWQGIEQKTGIQIQYKEKVESIKKDDQFFLVKTDKAEYKTQTVLLSIGRRGTPRKLGVEGESLPKVVYNLIDPEQYINQKVLIVGGGDSALEAALSIADQPGTEVSISYRSDSFSRAKEKNRTKIQQASDSGKINIIYSSNVKSITENNVTIMANQNELTLANDAVIISAGGILPTGFLKETGIQVDTKYGTA
ncbi:MAG: NAD(P)-binding domain-containing protein [Gammaproteobacteria bacterium]|nr:NAD(P)-binding domain-containing protein [Gammaproteobacteria bacterium]MCW8910168.1 NAD(P)-binding domain-containing protein [Gammaproteobacteria bacterium]MCW9004350.1 NAD(P)-binding domain-containing protein [Gammaproteobacteria bacterium]MCW9055455.1 NAD(P)-binding domain-containing protein [Gammaproteobacteria bacterium]